jgi:N utilization substance protein B
MGVRRQAREAALQILYMVDLAKMPLEDAAKMIWAGVELPAKAREFADLLAKGAAENRPGLDQVIVKYAENWDLHRMAAIDRNLLRLAAYELLHHADTPVSVVIDEAVEIAKHFSTLDSGKFVNGILDKIKLERPTVSPSEETPEKTS